MVRLDVTIQDRTYAVVCGPGEEGRVRSLASAVDEMVRDLRPAAGVVTDAHLFLLVSLTLRDRVEELEAEVAGLRRERESVTASQESQVAGAVSALADRVEEIAARLHGL